MNRHIKSLRKKLAVASVERMDPLRLWCRLYL
nr:hypothetical protein [Variovorax paradoxus]